MKVWSWATSAAALTLGLAIAMPAGPASAATAAVKHPVTKIVFADLGSGLWQVNANGTGLTRLTSDPDVTHPSYSPDGGTVAYASGGQIWRLGVTGDPVQVTSLPTGAQAEDPTWSPNGKWIAFSATVGPYHDLFKVSPQGGAVTRITWAASFGCSAYNPAWSPDSSTIAYQRADSPNIGCSTVGIYLQKLGQKPTAFKAPATAHSPSFTADGAHLLYLDVCNAPDLCGDNQVGYEATLAFGLVHIVSDEFDCHGDLCLEGLVASPAGGWVEAGEYSEDDAPNSPHETCWQGAKDGANQSKVLTAPSFCLANLYGFDFSLH
jgi:WD40-like Beta Propeller Repeat